MSRLLEQHRSPDAALTLSVIQHDGDISIGFDGYAWHTHADILASLSGLVADKAVTQFVDDLVSGRSIIAIARIAGQIQDIWVTDEPIASKYKPADETIEFRYWDGSPAT